MTNGYLLNTSVVSALAPVREGFVPIPLGEWLQAHHKELLCPPLSLQKWRMALASCAAALAQNAGLLLLTCNLEHFQPLGVACADPLVQLPA